MTIRITPPRENILRAAFTSAALRYMTPEIEEEVGRRMTRTSPSRPRPAQRAAVGGRRQMTENDALVMAHLPGRRIDIRNACGIPAESLRYCLGKLVKAGMIAGYGNGAAMIYHATGKTWAEAYPDAAPDPAIISRRRKIHAMKNSGMIIREIAEATGVSEMTVLRDLQEAAE